MPFVVDVKRVAQLHMERSVNGQMRFAYLAIVWREDDLRKECDGTIDNERGRKRMAHHVRRKSHGG